MTTLDDAAERRIIALSKKCNEDCYCELDVEDVIRTAWTEATEAAAKKCEKRAEDRMHRFGIYDDTAGAWEASVEVQVLCIEDDDCATAIRGKSS